MKKRLENIKINSYIVFRQEQKLVSANIAAHDLVHRRSFFTPLKVAIFIDGSNFYKKLKQIGIKQPSKLDYSKFVHYLVKDNNLVYLGYYVGEVRYERTNLKSVELYSKQQSFFTKIKKEIPYVKIVKGIIQNIKGVYKEKGVDVQLALDIYRMAVNHEYDKAILISSDTDLIPAIKMAQSLKKNIEYVGFENFQSRKLKGLCTYTTILTLNDLIPFITL